MANRGSIIADAVLAELVAGTWSQAFDGSRSFVVAASKVDTKRIVLYVQNAKTESVRFSRRHVKMTHTILISVRRNVDPASVASIEALDAFVEEIADFYQVDDGNHRIAGTTADVMSVETVPPDPDKLSTDREFFAGVALSVVEYVTP